MVTAVANRDELRADFGAFVDQVLAESGEPHRVAVEVFNTPVPDGATRADIAARVLANPLNRIGPLVHAAGPRTGRPLYVVHGIDGEVGWFLRHLRTAEMPRPVYGVVAPGWYGEPTPEDVVALAARHLVHIRAHQPEGPYSLGGYSSGAMIALEMARQLEERGAPVDLVISADPVLGSYRTTLGSAETTRQDVAVFRLIQLRHRRHPVMSPYFGLADRLEVADAVDLAWGERSPADPVERRFARGLDILYRLIRACRRSAIPMVSAAGLIVLTTPNASSGGTEFDADVDELRASFGGGAEVVTIEGIHNRLFENGTFQRLIGRRLQEWSTTRRCTG